VFEYSLPSLNSIPWNPKNSTVIYIWGQCLQWCEVYIGAREYPSAWCITVLTATSTRTITKQVKLNCFMYPALRQEEFTLLNCATLVPGKPTSAPGMKGNGGTRAQWHTVLHSKNPGRQWWCLLSEDFMLGIQREGKVRRPLGIPLWIAVERIYHDSDLIRCSHGRLGLKMHFQSMHIRRNTVEHLYFL
jgi:hypothetical protein